MEMLFASITEGGPDCWDVEVCSELWETFEHRLVFGTYEDAFNIGGEMVNKWMLSGNAE